MESLDLQQLERLFYLLLGMIALVLVILILYVVLANRRRRAMMDGGRSSMQVRERGQTATYPVSRAAGQVLSLVRDEVGGALKVEVGGRQYNRLVEIEDPDIKRQVVGAALELIQFTGVLGQADDLSAATAPVPVDRVLRWREDLREGSRAELEQIQVSAAAQQAQPPVSPAPSEVEEQFLSLLAEMGQAPPPREKPGILGSAQQRRIPKPTQAEPSRPFVDAIEDIVQRRVRLVPVLADRDLHVRLDSGGSVRFVFEGQGYDSLDDIPNMTARQLVKDAIREWEETT